MSNVPSVTTSSGRSQIAFAELVTLAPEMIIAAGCGGVQVGDTIGIITASEKGFPQKRTPITTAQADTTSVTTIHVAQARGFYAGQAIDIVDGGDDSSVLFNSKSIASVDYVNNTITLTAALGAGALDTTDWVRADGTEDGAQTAIGIALDAIVLRPDQTITTEDKMIRVMIKGVVYAALVPQLAADIYNYATDLKATSLTGGRLAIGE